MAGVIKDREDAMSSPLLECIPQAGFTFRIPVTAVKLQEDGGVGDRHVGFQQQDVKQL